jgi:hypothetical protein
MATPSRSTKTGASSLALAGAKLGGGGGGDRAAAADEAAAAAAGGVFFLAPSPAGEGEEEAAAARTSDGARRREAEGLLEWGVEGSFFFSRGAGGVSASACVGVGGRKRPLRGCAVLRH